MGTLEGCNNWKVSTTTGSTLRDDIMNMLHIMVQTYTIRVVQGTQSWMNEMGIELEGNDMRTALEVQRHLKTCLMEPAQLTCLLLMGGTVQGLTRVLQRLGPLDSKSPTGRPGTTGTGRGTITADSVTLAPAVQRFVDTICELPSSVMGKLNWSLVPLVGRSVANGFEKMSRIYFEQLGP